MEIPLKYWPLHHKYCKFGKSAWKCGYKTQDMLFHEIKEEMQDKFPIYKWLMQNELLS